MKKNKTHFLTTLFTTIFLLASSQNLAAQNNSKNLTTDTDTDEEVEDVKNNEQQLQLTIEKVDPSRFNSVAIIQGLNKITAKTSLIEIKIGDTITFGKLTITAHKCWQAPLEQKPESKILLEIFDNSGNAADKQSRARIFYGWMFSSSPSVSALEHPIYDITAVGCKNR